MTEERLELESVTIDGKKYKIIGAYGGMTENDGLQCMEYHTQGGPSVHAPIRHVSGVFTNGKKIKYHWGDGRCQYWDRWQPTNWVGERCW